MTARQLSWIAWLGITLAGLSLVLVVVNIVLAAMNARTQAEVDTRQRFIVDAPQYNAIGGALVRSLDAAASTGDLALIAMMRRHGLNPSKPAADSSPVSPAR